MASTPMSACEFVLIRIAPDPIRNEAVNIGVALYDPAAGGFAGVRISPDLRRLRQLSPLFEEGDLAGLEADLLARLQAPAAAEQFWRSREYFLKFAQESFSHAVQISAPALVLTADPAAELDRLYQQYAAPIVAPATAAVTREVTSARRAILRHLQRVFTEERVLARLGRNVRAGEWLGEPDAFRFDYHYRPNGVHHAIQAVPLSSDETAIKELCFTVTRLRQRLGGLDVAGFDQPAAALSAQTAAYHRGLLGDAGVRIMTLAEAPAEAARIRSALGMD